MHLTLKGFRYAFVMTTIFMEDNFSSYQNFITRFIEYSILIKHFNIAPVWCLCFSDSVGIVAIFTL